MRIKVYPNISKWKKCLFFILLSLIILYPRVESFGQEVDQRRGRDKSGRDEKAIKLNATLVQVPVIVSDLGGRYTTDLKKEDFELFEDGVEQDIELFGSVEEPFSVALLLDSSGSTAEQLALIKKAALVFIGNLRAQDKVMVFSFNDSVQQMCPLTGDRNILRNAIETIESGEYTQVYEAVYTAVWERLRGVSGRKAVIMFSDGIDTASSEIDAEDTLDAVVETEDIIIYPIRYNTKADVIEKLVRRREGDLKVSHSAEASKSWEETIKSLDDTYRVADDYLSQLAELSGGVLERADRLEDLEQAFTRIAEELRHQYLLGYYPKDSESRGMDRRIKVRVRRPNLRVRARPGYK